MSDLSNPGLVIGRLEELLADRAERMNPHEESVRQLIQDEAWWKHTVQLALLKADGRNKEEREARAETTAIAANPERYQRLIELRSGVGATKEVARFIDTATSALQSILRAQTREAYGASAAAQPAWSKPR